MAVGFSQAFANMVLDAIFSGGTFTSPAAIYIQLHTGDPGAAGTANVSSFTTRTVVTPWNAASGGSKSLTAPGIVITASWAGTSPESVGYVSYWSAVTGGTFITSDQLVAPVVVTTGSALNLPSLVAPFTAGIAA